MISRFVIAVFGVSAALCAAAVLPQSPTAENVCKSAGRFCLRNLTGWNECKYNQHTGHYDSILHVCRKNTRCACYYGIDCPPTVKDPCTKYITPPSLPDSFTFTFAGIRSTCVPDGCKNYTYAGVRYVDHKYGGRYRQDISSNTGLSTYIIPSANKLAGYQTVWEDSKCTKVTFPEYTGFLIPSYFSYDLEEKVEGRLAKRWFWFEKLTKPTDVYVTIYMYSIKGKKSGETYLIRSAQKTYVPSTHLTDWVNETYTIFKTEKHLSQRFQLPSLCNQSF